MGGGQGNGGGQGSGVVAPGEARGWMTLAQVSEANAIPVEEILAAFDLPAATDPATELRDLESDGVLGGRAPRLARRARGALTRP